MSKDERDWADEEAGRLMTAIMNSAPSIGMRVMAQALREARAQSHAEDSPATFEEYFRANCASPNPNFAECGPFRIEDVRHAFNAGRKVTQGQPTVDVAVVAKEIAAALHMGGATSESTIASILARHFRADESRAWQAEAVLANPAALHVHILRNWDREQIVRVALHLLGDEAQTAHAAGYAEGIEAAAVIVEEATRDDGCRGASTHAARAAIATAMINAIRALLPQQRGEALAHLREPSGEQATEVSSEV